ncbi:glycosyltransferase family 2 protein [Hydrogenophaga sp.]|uniref:glycosyltransferase family 2 protein n=1 Tax=Hydrogenophaga sp. TaxID=1904254 RepID=UPI002726A3B1|nr:glycosyltransferase family 2 protein [Hydrogenophaga sp.]MDO9605235.1 glycosyltransferase family 2 protein [Hydrogenophaga sp.]
MPQPTVHILLATYNGGRFLAEQLSSIARQTHTAWTLTVSDDGSTDDTLDIVAQFAEQVSQPITVLTGPCQGSSTRNFFHLIQHAQARSPSDLFAFCDQDDVWLDYKLARAAAWHLENSKNPVRLYCSRTQFVDEQLKPIGLSPGIQRAPTFGNALVQNIASGNTMVMSQAVLMAQKKVQPEHSVWHDWTTYLVATALGGQVWFDNHVGVSYRQHARNVIGSNNGVIAQVKRLKPLATGRFRQWTDAGLAAVKDLETLPTPSALDICHQFAMIRSNPFIWRRLMAWRKTGIRRQTIGSNLSLAFGLMLSLV